MKVIIDIEEEKINSTRNKVRELKDCFLIWAVDNESPAKYPEDILWFLRTFHEVDSHFLDIINKLWQSKKQPDETHCQM